MRPSPRSGRYRPGASRCCELRVPALAGRGGRRQPLCTEPGAEFRTWKWLPTGNIASPTPSLIQFQVWSPRTSFCISFLLHQQNLYQARTVLCQPSKPNLNKTGSVMHKGLSFRYLFLNHFDISSWGWAPWLSQFSTSVCAQFQCHLVQPNSRNRALPTSS